MAIEAGGKSGISPPTKSPKHTSRRGAASLYDLQFGRRRVHSERFTINLDELEPIVALPDLPSNGRFIGDVAREKMDQVYIGSCTNGRIEDLRIAAQIFKGNKVAAGTRAIVVPATTEIWKTAMREGLLEIFADAGCVVSTATCGACLGGFMGVLGAEEKCLSTTNRNFVGRMGSPKSKVYLASPATAAATAITGRLRTRASFEIGRSQRPSDSERKFMPELPTNLAICARLRTRAHQH